MNKSFSLKILGFVFFTVPVQALGEPAVAEWAVMIYLQARNNLAPFAAANLDALSAWAGSPKVNFLAQWDQPRKQGSWRYKIDRNNVNLVNYVAAENPTDIGGKLVDFVAWVKANYPAKNYCLVFWDHGIGIVDPCYGSKDLLGVTNSDPLFLIRKDVDAGLCKSEDVFQDMFDLYVPKKEQLELDKTKAEILKVQNKTATAVSSTLSTVNSLLEQEASQLNLLEVPGIATETSEQPIHRGILFDEEHQSYLNSQGLEAALKKIMAILGKKLAIVGFDACFMSNWEVAYQIAQYAEFMVGSEELELPKGWDYKRIGEFLANNPTATPEALARQIVRAYGLFYQGQTNMYTQTVVRLDKVASVKEKFSAVLTRMDQLSRDEKIVLVMCMQEARKLAVQLTAKVFIDLNSWITVLIQSLQSKIANFYSNTAKKPLGSKGSLDGLVSLLQALLAELNLCILENVTSTYLSKLTGLSIYFPVRSIEPSYSNCKFATDSNWLAFIKTTNIF